MNKSLLIIPLTVGYLFTNCYLVACEETLDALVIDPGFNNEGSKVLNEVARRNLRVKYIVNTHGHVDHISGNARVKEATGARIAVHHADAEMLREPLKNLSTPFLGLTVVSPPPDLTLQDGGKIKVGFLEFEVVHTPGHTPGSISLYCRDEKVVFTGDTLFAGSIGRTDLPGASHERLIRSIREKLLIMPDDTVVYPGHGDRTTIGRERMWNPFINLDSW